MRHDGEDHDYRRKAGVIESEIIGWDGSRADLWTGVEEREKHPRARVAREVRIALPHELPQTEQIRLARQLAERLGGELDCPVQLDVHEPNSAGDERNVHAHLLFPTRDRSGAKHRHLDSSRTSGEHVERWRAEWERDVNAALALHGFAERVDHRSHVRRDLADEPQIHLGAAAAIERRGRRTDRGNENRKRRRQNRRRHRRRRQIGQVQTMSRRRLNRYARRERADRLTRRITQRPGAPAAAERQRPTERARRGQPHGSHRRRR